MVARESNFTAEEPGLHYGRYQCNCILNSKAKVKEPGLLLFLLGPGTRSPRNLKCDSPAGAIRLLLLYHKYD